MIISWQKSQKMVNQTSLGSQNQNSYEDGLKNTVLYKKEKKKKKKKRTFEKECLNEITSER